MVNLAKRMEVLRASEIREILKVTQRPEVISFAGGLPAPEHFPVKELEQETVRVLREMGPQALQYSTTEGHPPLRTWIATRMTDRLGARVSADQVLITSGSQQGLDLSGKIFLDEGDEVLCESPTYLGAINAMRAYGPRFVDVATDDDGMLPDDLERCLSTCKRPKLLYTIPDFQNPSGRCWSRERRQQVLEIVSRYDIIVVEDCPYRDLRFEGVDQPTLKSLDARNQVVFLGTFSKTFCPGLRLGWVAAPQGLIEKYVLVKQGVDLHTSSLSQLLLAAYLEDFDMDANVARMRATYLARRDAMQSAIAREFPPEVRCTHPQGGLFVWAELPPQINARDLLVECLKHDVAFVPGGSFFAGGGHENTMRLNFSNMPQDRIAEGIRRLASVIRTKMGAG